MLCFICIFYTRPHTDTHTHTGTHTDRANVVNILQFVSRQYRVRFLRAGVGGLTTLINIFNQYCNTKTVFIFSDIQSHKMVAYFKIHNNNPVSQSALPEANLADSTALNIRTDDVRRDSGSRVGVDQSFRVSVPDCSISSYDVGSGIPATGGHSSGLATYLYRFLRTADRLSGRDINILSPTSL